jgi:outer membrane protein OmpA-like peptidoglycan-associated protein
MKKLILVLVLIFGMYSCVEKQKDKPGLDGKKTQTSNPEFADTDDQDSKLSLNDLMGDLEEEGWEFEGENSKEGSNKNAMETMFSTSEMLDMLESSGASREAMEKLINNPDSLKILAQKAIENRKNEQQEKEENAKKGKISNEQLTSKNTPTGVSIEEAILIVQAESGPEATMAILKKIDSIAGTNVMEQIDMTEAGYIMGDIERKHEQKASPEEEIEMKLLRDKSGQMHSEKEAKVLLAALEQTEEDIVSGKIKVSPKYERTIKHQKGTVKIFHNSIVRKSKAAKSKFKKLNPDLYFGEEAGNTYIGFNNTAVYLPLGDLSFADQVISSNHPLLLTQEVNNVLGTPDKIETFDDVTGIYSLGLGGDLTVRFTDNALTNVNGPDLYIFEIGQIEPTDLEISKDGKNWIKVGKIDGGVAEVDIEKFVKQDELFYYVRLKDLKQKSALPGADVDAIAAIGAAMRLNLDSNVLFDSGKSQLKPAGIEALKNLANSIQVLKRGSVIIEGHTDDVGSDQANQNLSLARAKSVSSELKKLIPSSSFKWREKGLGESKPLVENISEENRAKNRRVEVLVLPN